MSSKSRPRLRTRHLQNKCALCRDVAIRFKDVNNTRTWYCATHHKETEENGNAKESIIGD
jgi:hypothetical protein